MSYRILLMVTMTAISLPRTALAQDSRVDQNPSLPPSTVANVSPGGPSREHFLNREGVAAYLKRVAGPAAVVHAALWSFVEQTASGGAGASFGHRVGSHLGLSAVAETTKDELAAALGQDPSFQRCACTGVISRFRHAVIGPFSARSRDGRTVFSVTSLGALAAGQTVANATWDANRTDARNPATHLAVGVAGLIGASLWKEFLPERYRTR